MNIVKAEASYLDGLTSLALKLWPENSWEHLRAEFEELIGSESDMIYIAIIDGASVGFIHMSLRFEYVEGSDSSPVGYIEGIYVEPDHRNRGISRQLVEAGELWSKACGCKQVASDTELHNLGSQEFHKKIGYREVNRIVAFIKDL